MLLDIEQKENEVIVSYYDKKGEVSFKRYRVDNFENWTVAEDNDRYRDQNFKNWDGRAIKRKRSTNLQQIQSTLFYGLSA